MLGEYFLSKTAFIYRKNESFTLITVRTKMERKSDHDEIVKGLEIRYSSMERNIEKSRCRENLTIRYLSYVCRICVLKNTASCDTDLAMKNF